MFTSYYPYVCLVWTCIKCMHVWSRWNKFPFINSTIHWLASHNFKMQILMALCTWMMASFYHHAWKKKEQPVVKTPLWEHTKSRGFYFRFNSGWIELLRNFHLLNNQPQRKHHTLGGGAAKAKIDMVRVWWDCASLSFFKQHSCFVCVSF